MTIKKSADKIEKKQNRRDRMRKKRQFVAGLIAIVLILVMVLTLVLAALPAHAEAVHKSNTQKIQNTQNLQKPFNAEDSQNVQASGKPGGRIFIGDLDVTGKTVTEIEKVADERLAELKMSPIIFSAGEQKAASTAGALGLGWDLTDEIRQAVQVARGGNILHRFLAQNELQVGENIIFDPHFKVSDEKIREAIEKLSSNLNSEPEGNSLTRTKDGFHITKARDGITVDVDSSVAAVRSFMEKEWFGGPGEVTLSYKNEKAEDSTADLKKITAMRGTAKGTYDKENVSRAANLAKLCELIGGKVLYPGEEFSFHAMTGKKGKGTGFRKARPDHDEASEPSYEEGSDQIATLLYQAVLCSELIVTKREASDAVPPYAEASLDASVEGDKDLVFENSTQSPIYLEAAAGDGKIRVTIYGESKGSDDRTVALLSQILQTTPVETILKTDDHKEIGSIVEKDGQQGVTSEGYLAILKDGQEESRKKITRDEYEMVPRTFFIGTKGADKKALVELRKAVRAKDYNAAMRVVEEAASRVKINSVPTPGVLTAVIVW